MGRVRDGDSARKKTRGDRPASGAVASGVAVIGATPTETPTLGWHGRMEHGRGGGGEGGASDVTAGAEEAVARMTTVPLRPPQRTHAARGHDDAQHDTCGRGGDRQGACGLCKGRHFGRCNGRQFYARRGHVRHTTPRLPSPRRKTAWRVAGALMTNGTTTVAVARDGTATRGGARDTGNSPEVLMVRAE